MPTDATYPIILFPGIMGSRLYFPNSGRYWDPDSTFRMLRWLIAPSSTRAILTGSQPADIVQSPLWFEFNAAQESRGWGGAVWSYYGGFLQFLESLGPNPVYAIGYDWRQDIGSLGIDALTRVREILTSTGAAKAVLIAHSMGGLVVRAAFRQDPTFNDQVHKNIFICQPSAGAPVMYRRLFTGLDANYDAGWAFRRVLGSSRQIFLGNVSGLPGAMQLVPSASFPGDAASVSWNPLLPVGTDPAAIYADPNSPPGMVPNNIGLDPAVLQDLNDRVIDINAFFQFLGHPNDPVTSDPAKTWLIYGTNKPTETKVQINGATVTPVVQNTGDTTVPDISAMCLGLPPNQMIAVSNITHSTACLDQTVQSFVQANL
jgi:pimeloyl-ACP methyl ester carboxylesterase